MAPEPESRLEATIALAVEALEALRAVKFDAVVIGGIALAVHGYPRATEDLDLAVAVPLDQLRAVADTLARRGHTVELREPDAQDPLGGVVDIRRDGADLVQLVNFDNSPSSGFPQLVVDAIASAQALVPGGPLQVVDAYHLIAFKLYAGDPSSKLDIVQLLACNPQLDLDRLRRLCEGYRLATDLEAVLSLR